MHRANFVALDEEKMGPKTQWWSATAGFCFNLLISPAVTIGATKKIDTNLLITITMSTKTKLITNHGLLSTVLVNVLIILSLKINYEKNMFYQ